MLFRGQPIVRRGGNVVHRYATDRQQELGADSRDDDKKRRYSSHLSRTSTHQRAVFIICIIALAIKWTRDCHFLLHFGSTSPSVPPSRHEQFGLHPLQLQLSSWTSLTNATRLSFTEDVQFPHRKNHYWIKGKTREYKPAQVIPEHCQAEDWMNDMHPSCLDLHEVDLSDFFFNKDRSSIVVDGKKRRRKVQFLGQGGFRTAIMFHDNVDGQQRVLKTLNFANNRNFDPRNYDRARRDAIVSEQLTASPYIADIYGYCGQSALVDYSQGDTLDWIFEQDNYKPTKEELFQIAVDVVQSVADASHVNPNTGRATIVHMDLKPDQWIRLNGKWILNDFNLARFLTWDAVKQENCNVASGYSGGRFQAPEQFLENSPRTDKIDVYSLGNILGFLLTEDGPFPEESDDTAEELVTNGTIWNITDPFILSSTHPFDVNVRKAMEMCLVLQPEKRPSAQQVADFLRQALLEYQLSKVVS